MGYLFGSFGFLGIILFIILIVILPISVYAAQKWAYKCFKELEKLNKKIDCLTGETTKDKPGEFHIVSKNGDSKLFHWLGSKYEKLKR